MEEFEKGLELKDIRANILKILPLEDDEVVMSEM